MSDSLDDFFRVSQAIRLSAADRREARAGIQAFMAAHPLVADVPASAAFEQVFTAATAVRMKMGEKDAGRQALAAFMRRHPQRGASRLHLDLWKGINIFGAIRPFFLSPA